MCAKQAAMPSNNHNWSGELFSLIYMAVAAEVLAERRRIADL